MQGHSLLERHELIGETLIGLPPDCWTCINATCSASVSALPTKASHCLKAKVVNNYIALQGSTTKVSRQLQLQEEDITPMQENRSPLASPLAQKKF